MPHHFPSLVEGPAQAVLIAGTGFSAPNAPTVGTLKGKLDLVAEDLGIDPNDNFYDLAEAILDKLKNDGYGDPNDEGRVLVLELKNFYIATVYTPNSKDDLSRVKLRQKRSPLGKTSISRNTLAPVVLKPDVDSKSASMNELK